MKKNTRKADPAAAAPQALLPLVMDCVKEIASDSELNFLQKPAAISYLLERTKYRPPEGAAPKEIKRVLLSAARAEAALWFPADMDGQESKKRCWLHRFILGAEQDEIPAPPFKMSLSEWTNFFRSADQARQTYRGQFKFAPGTGTKCHPTIKSAFIPFESLSIVYHWASPNPDAASLSHCTAELACEIISTFSDAAHDPKNFPRKKSQLGLVSYSKAEFRGHLQHL